jgi:hypothetical protein
MCTHHQRRSSGYHFPVTDLAELKLASIRAGLWPVFLQFLKREIRSGWTSAHDLIAGDCRLFHVAPVPKSLSVLEQVRTHVGSCGTQSGA